MTRWIALSAIVLLGLAAIFIGERQRVQEPVGPNALLYLIGDTEQELTRMPVRFTRMPDEEEIRVGNDLSNYYKRDDKPTSESTDIAKYINEVGWRLAPYAHRRLPYQFHYIPDKDLINAFALPGGHVYIGQGLLALMDSEDELASVLGHEIEHIDHYHCAERVQQERAMRKLPLGELFAIPIEVFEAGYSKDQELEADREGTRLAVRAGYSANGAIRMFETFQRLYDQTHGRAANPAEELQQVALDTLQGYFRSHPLPAERIAQIHTLIASEHWELHAERDLGVAYIFQTDKARDLLQAGKYPQAQGLALQALKVKPDHASALETLAQAQFAQADFAASAETYRRLIALNPYNSAAEAPYAQALAAVDRATAAEKFRQSPRVMNPSEDSIFDVQLAGLSLLAGRADSAKRITQSATRDLTLEWAPGALLDLGWWYYLSGDYSSALNLVGNAQQQRPGNILYATRLGWVQIEQHTLADALHSLSVNDQGAPTPERLMARAVALWQARQADEAMGYFGQATEEQPSWENPEWVKTLFSPGVAHTVEQMKSERDRRRRVEARRTAAETR